MFSKKDRSDFLIFEPSYDELAVDGEKTSQKRLYDSRKRRDVISVFDSLTHATSCKLRSSCRHAARLGHLKAFPARAGAERFRELTSSYIVVKLHVVATMNRYRR